LLLRQQDLTVFGFGRYGVQVTQVNQMEPGRRRERALSFGRAAALYDAVRPSYPDEAIRWALAPLGPGRHRVADVGAGTGILTRVIASLGHDPVAVEPDQLMRDRLRTTTSGVGFVDGSAESMPFADGAVDAALAGQAYHWFDREPAHRELARVVRPGGVFAAVWNERDITVPWLAEYSRLIDGDRGLDGSGRDSGRHMSASYGDSFQPTERAEFRHTVTCTPDSLVRLLGSRSYFLTASRARQVELAAAVRRLAAAHPDLAGAPQFPLPYITEVYRAVRR
jgi:SAM-dependent methyltransferase